jgi:hypothetical protein
MMRTAFFVLMFWGGSLLASSTEAAPTGTGNAQAQFVVAQQMFDAGRMAEAAEMFREVYRLTGSPNAHFMLARSLIALDRLAEAHQEMTGALREATDAAHGDPDRYEKTRDAAATQLALLDRRVGKLIVVLLPSESGSSLKLDGVVLKENQVGIPMAVKPGAHRLEATFPNGNVTRSEVELSAGETRTITLSPSRAPAVPGTAGIRTPPPPPQPPAPVRTAGVVVTAVGVAGGALFAVSALSAAGTFSRLQDECGNKRCTDPSYAGVVDEGQRWQTIANVALAVGATGIVAGGLMIALGGAPSAPRVSLFVTPATPHSAAPAVQLEGRF